MRGVLTRIGVKLGAPKGNLFGRTSLLPDVDGSLLVSYRGVVLTPSEAPVLVASRQDQASAIPKEIPPAPEQVPGWERQPSTSNLGKQSSPTIWYEDSKLKRRHRELVKTGMERARKLGKRIGRPPVTERDGFAERFREVVERIGPGGLSHRQAASELDIGLATLKRLLEAGEPPAVATGTPRCTLLPSVAGRYMPQNEITDKIA